MEVGGGATSQEWAKEMAKIAAFKKMSDKGMAKLKLYVKSWAGT